MWFIRFKHSLISQNSTSVFTKIRSILYHNKFTKYDYSKTILDCEGKIKHFSFTFYSTIKIFFLTSRSFMSKTM